MPPMGADSLLKWGLEEVKVKQNVSAAELSIKGGAYE
jgi:hypothetical protein